MNLKTYKSIGILVGVLGLIVPLGSSVQAQTPVFDKLKDKFDQNLVFKAAFEHTYLDSYTEESINSSGLIWIDKSGYKLESEDQLIVVDGEISTVYDGLRNRIIVSEYDAEEDDFAPSRMLSGIDETYSASEKMIDNGSTEITLVTEDDFAIFVKVEIVVDRNLKPIKITAYDIADNIIITSFKNGEFETRDAKTFKLEYPEGAEIVDMRF